MSLLVAPNALAIVDTNVFLDVYSCNDLAGLYNDPSWNAALDEHPALYRRARARDSLLLAMHLHEQGATTNGLHSEQLARLEAVSPPAGESLSSHYTHIFIHFVKDHVLPGWDAQIPTTPDGFTSNKADAALLSAARIHGLPLITNEGFTPAGIESKGLRKRAAAEGVWVGTPREFLVQRDFDEASAIEGFLARFRAHAPAYVASRRDRSGEVLSWVLGYFRHVLRGETEGRDVPVAVKLP